MGQEVGGTVIYQEKRLHLPRLGGILGLVPLIFSAPPEVIKSADAAVNKAVHDRHKDNHSKNEEKAPAKPIIVEESADDDEDDGLPLLKAIPKPTQTVKGGIFRPLYAEYDPEYVKRRLRNTIVLCILLLSACAISNNLPKGAETTASTAPSPTAVTPEQSNDLACPAPGVYRHIDRRLATKFVNESFGQLLPFMVTYYDLHGFNHDQINLADTFERLRSGEMLEEAPELYYWVKGNLADSPESCQITLYVSQD